MISIVAQVRSGAVKVVPEVPGSNQHTAHALDRLGAPAEVCGEYFITGIAFAALIVQVRDRQLDCERQAILSRGIAADRDEPIEFRFGVRTGDLLDRALMGVTSAHGRAGLHRVYVSCREDRLWWV